MSEAAKPVYDDERMAQIGVRLLTPESTSIFEGTFSLMHCQVKGDNLYRGVFAVLMFPISHPDLYVSLRYTASGDKEKEIGVIADLSIFPEEAQTLVRDNLRKHYHERIITRIHSIENKFGLLFFEVETQTGPVKFILPWRGDRAEDYGPSGKVLLDAFDNRYIVPDVSALPDADRNVFQSFIYW